MLTIECPVAKDLLAKEPVFGFSPLETDNFRVEPPRKTLYAG
jgi:hypothetical protein